MNREARRKQGDYITMQNEIIKAKKEGILRASDDLITLFTVAMHVVHGLGAKRIKKVLDKVDNILQCVEAGTVTLSDLRQLRKDITHGD